MKLNNKFENIDLVKEIMDQADEEIKKMPPVNILVAGKTGVGKSTLINGLFREKLATTGVGEPVTQHIQKIQKEGMPITLYDTRGLELSPQVQKQVTDEIADIYEKTLGTEDQIFVTFYCINANSNRIEEAEIELIQNISEKMPVIIVLTQSIGEPALKFKAYLEGMDLPVVDIINVMADDYKISDELIIEQFGLKELIEQTVKVIPDDIERAFTNAQHADIARKAKSARRWARKYIAASFGVGFVPIPFSDASILVPMQITLIAHITAIFGISLDKSTLVSVVAGVFGTTGATQGGRYIATNLLKLIPGAGSLAGGAVSALTASMITSALAMSYIEILTLICQAEKEGKLDQLPDIQSLMKDKFSDQLNKRQKASNLEELESLSNDDIKHMEEEVEQTYKEIKQPNEKQAGLVEKLRNLFNL